MPIYRGLNIAKGMIDVDDPVEALTNLGLNIDDLELISGLTNINVDIKDFHTMANLTEDQQKVFKGMMSTAERTGELLDTLADIAVPMNFNILINSQLAGSAIKYNYLNFTGIDANNYYETKKADISTSRISSWSPIGPEATPDSVIFYGGEINSRSGGVSYTDLSTSVQPLAKSFRAEVPTHILKIKVNGVEQNVMAMKGIPLIFDTQFRDCDLTASVIGIQDSTGSTIPMTWRVTNLDQTGTVYSSGDGSGNTGSVGIGTLDKPSIYLFRDSASRPRRLEFFYNPSKIEQLKITGANISKWTNVSLPALKKLDLSLNDLAVIPEFRFDSSTPAINTSKTKVVTFAGLAPILEEITLTGNGLDRAALHLQGDSNITDNVAGATANAQLNRLPLTIKKIFVNGCFSDSTEVDLTDFVDLKEFSMGTQYSSNLTRRMTGGTTMPSVADTTKSSSLFREWSDLINNSKVIISMNNNPLYYRWYDSLYEDVGGLNNSDYICVKYFNGAFDNSGTIELPTGYPNGANNSGLVPGNLYYIRYANENTANYIVARLYSHPDQTELTGFSSEDGVHCFKKADPVTGEVLYDDTRGIEKYSIDNQTAYQRLPVGVSNSSKVKELVFTNTQLSCNSELPHLPPSGASNAVKDGISADRAISLRSTEITKFLSTNNRTSLGSHNIINMSNKENLVEYRQTRMLIRSHVRAAEKTANGKFDNCPALVTFDLLATNATGDFRANGMFQNKPNLEYIDIRYTNLRGRLNDDVFGNNTTNLKKLFIAGWSFGNDNNDLLGIDGSAGHTGQSLKKLNKLERLYIYNTDRAVVRFVDSVDNTKQLDLSGNLNLRIIYCADGGLTGKLPDLYNNQKVYYISGARNRSNLQARWVQPGVKHTIVSFYNTANPSHSRNNTTQMWKDIGWTNINAFTGESQGKNGGADPEIGDTFVASTISVADTALIAGKRYRIYDIGTTSLSDWNTITGQSKTDLEEYRNPYNNYYYYEFTSPGTSAGAVSGTGQVRPDGYDRVLTAGLDEPLPAWNSENLRWVYLQNNSIPGQFPRMIGNRFYRIWANNNRLSGNIPDLTGMPYVRQIRLQNNQISGYSPGSLETAKYLTTLNLRNNKLPASVAIPLIDDLYKNYLLRNRGGVNINLQGQAPDGGAPALTESAVNADNIGELSSANKLAALRNAGWTILLD
jgi:hypothetical protein